MNKIKVLIADDHSIVREGLKQLLELEKDFEVIGFATNGEEAVSKIALHRPDVVLMDINMPVMNGIQALKKIRENKLLANVIMLTIHEEREYLLETMQNGANGYLLKDCDSASLYKAIRDTYNSETYIQPKLAALLVKELNRPKTEHKSENDMTQREYEVLCLIADGKNNKEIADTLFISEKTVKNHVSNIFRKIKVNDRTQAAIYAYKNNLVK